MKNGNIQIGGIFVMKFQEKRDNRKIRRILVICVILILIVALIFVIIYVLNKNKQNYTI